MMWRRSIVVGSLVAMVVCCGGQPAKAEDAPKLERFFGKWVGKWDGKWAVEFTISQDPKSRELRVIYAHQEQVGEPLQQEESFARFEDGKVFVGNTMEIELSPVDPNLATVVGRFEKRRVAVLDRQKLPQKG